MGTDPVNKTVSCVMPWNLKAAAKPSQHGGCHCCRTVQVPLLPHRRGCRGCRKVKVPLLPNERGVPLPLDGVGTAVAGRGHRCRHTVQELLLPDRGEYRCRRTVELLLLPGRGVLLLPDGGCHY